jgi:hypothetical protein
MKLFGYAWISRLAGYGGLLSLICLWGCGASLQLTRINSDQKKPNNVWVFFTVQQGEEPVAGLAAEDFEIYEDGARVSPYESQQVILNPEVAAVMYTLLLLDVSGSITESGQIEPLVDAAELFVERVGKTQKVGVYASTATKRSTPSCPSRARSSRCAAASPGSERTRREILPPTCTAPWCRGSRH